MSRDMSLVWQMGVAGAAGAMSSFSKATQAIIDMKESTEDLAKTQKKLEKLDKVAEVYRKTNSEYNKSVKLLEVLKEAYRKNGNATSEFKEQIKNVKKNVEKLNRQKERQKHIFQAARSELEKEGIELYGYKKRLKEVNAELKKQAELQKRLTWLQSQNDMVDKLKAKGSEQIRTGLATGAALLVPIKIQMDIEESQADLRKILGKEAEKYYVDLAKISENSPLSQVEVNQIAGSLAQSGIKGEDIVAYTDMAGKMKVAFDISTDEAGTFLAKTKEQLNLSKDELFSYMDTLNMLSNNYSVSAAQLADISGRTGGLAKQFGIAKEANMAFATSLISSNMGVERSSTVLSKLYAELAQGADTNKKAAAFEALGLNPDAIHKEMAIDAEGTILKVLEKIKNSNRADKALIISDIFGNDASVLNGLAVLSENLDGVREKLNQAKQVVSENETVNGEYTDRLDTLSNQLKILKNNFVNTLADIGKSVGPELKETVKWLTEMMKKVANFVKENPKLVASLMKFLGGFAMFNLGGGLFNKMLLAPLSKLFLWGYKFNAFRLKGGFLFSLKKMFPITTWLLKGFKSLTFGISKAFFSISKTVISYGSSMFMGLRMYLTSTAKFIGSWGLKLGKGLLKFGSIVGKVLGSGFLKIIKVIKMIGLTIKSAFLTNPVGLLIAAIIAVIVIFVVLYKKVEWFRNGVKLIFGGFIEYIKGICKVVVGIFTLNGDMIKEGFHNVVNGIKKIFSGVGLIVKNVWKIVKDNLKSVWDWIKTKFKEIWAKIKEYSVMFIPFVGVFILLYKKCEWFRNVVNAVWIAIKNAFANSWEWIKNKFNSLIEIGSKAWNGLKDGATAIIDKIRKAFSGFFDWLNNKWESIKNFGSKLNPFNWFGKKDNSIPQNYLGTNYFGGGLTTLAERGAELVEVNNNSYLIASQMLANLPRGAKILNNSQTRKKIEGINKNNNKIPFNLKKLYQVSKNILIKNSYKNKKVVNSETKNIQNYALKNSYNLKKDKETPKTNSLSSRVLSLKDRIKNISNSNLKTTIGGDTITINLHCNSENKMDIAREVKRVIEEMQSKKRRTAIV